VNRRGNRPAFLRISRILLIPVLLLLLVAPASADCVILLHGLLRSATSMAAMEQELGSAGYRVANVDYPSRAYTVGELAPMAVEAGLATCGEEAPVHFVTHSMGGILVRYYLWQHALPTLGRVVMLAPPNQGSEVVDALGDMPGFRLMNGPAGMQLGTGPDGIPAQLPPVDYPVGIIAGTCSINLLLSRFLPNPDDGKVSVQRTKVEGMTDFIEVSYSHPLIMQRREVMDQVSAFLSSGHFSPLK
jgi:triacylglycerol lipase